MLSTEQVKELMTRANLGTVEVVAPYKGDFLVRVSTGDDEDGLDPFYKVAGSDGTISEFSVMRDGDMKDIAAAFAAVK